MPPPSAPARSVSARRLRSRLLSWFARQQRDLPWRHTRDPYRIWVSEIMLQQTQVATVIPYYRRFLEAFPDVQSLAASREEKVLRLWEGLGYYRRARDLHRAAKIVARQHGGMVPSEPDAFAQLPGIGRYMRGAVLSQAFDRRLPILEANSLRVLCRLFAFRGDPRKPALRNRLWEAAARLLPARRVGDFNQALMELGALICRPRQPRCDQCPLAGLCAARAQGVQHQLPPPARKAKITPVEEAAVVIRRGDELLLVQRPAEGRWANLWEFPHGPIEPGETPTKAALRLARELTGACVRIGQPVACIRHGITRFRITITCFEATYREGRFRSGFYRRGEWVRPDRLSAYALSSPQRKLARLRRAQP